MMCAHCGDFSRDDRPMWCSRWMTRSSAPKSPRSSCESVPLLSRSRGVSLVVRVGVGACACLCLWMGMRVNVGEDKPSHNSVCMRVGGGRTQTQHIGRGLRGSPAAVWDDGECNVCALEHEPVAEQLRVLNGLKSNGAHFNFAEVQRQGRHVTLDFKSHEGLFNIDGQVARFEVCVYLCVCVRLYHHIFLCRAVAFAFQPSPD
jgi:hypothetical protein